MNTVHLFTGKKIYYSGSIKGASELDPTFGWRLVSYMTEHGAQVLSEHVAATTKEEMQCMFSKNSGMSIYDLYEGPDAAINIRKQCMDWVDEATHVIALVNAPSHGVGMEIERALLKTARGLPATPILCLMHADMQTKVSNMIKGISPKECSVFQLQSYTSLEEAHTIIYEFLMQK